MDRVLKWKPDFLPGGISGSPGEPWGGGGGRMPSSMGGGRCLTETIQHVHGL